MADGRRCDVPTETERLTGRSDPANTVKVHRWREPVRLGDPCYCGERRADQVLVDILNEHPSEDE
jgi:hypothetical protein